MSSSTPHRMSLDSPEQIGMYSSIHGCPCTPRPSSRDSSSQMSPCTPRQAGTDSPHQVVTESPHQKIIGDYELQKRIGAGGFGSVYRVIDTKSNQAYAMKISYIRKSASIRREFSFMSELQASDRFPKVVKLGETTSHVYYVMELLGASIMEVQEEVKHHKFSVSTVIRTGINMISAIKELHAHNILHRDIKASNFLIRPNHQNPIVLIDLGLGQKTDFSQPDDPPGSPPHPFVGNHIFASVNVHEGRKMGRNDDLMSWFYVLLYMLSPRRLPWSKFEGKQIVQAKVDFDIQKDYPDLPQQFYDIYNYIKSLTLRDAPNYEWIVEKLSQAMGEIHANWSDSYEWETLSEHRVRRISAVDIRSPLEVPEVKPKALEV